MNICVVKMRPSVSRSIVSAAASIKRAPGDTQNKCQEVKPFLQIPGPVALPLIGSVWKYILPGPNRYDPERLHEVACQKYDEFGPLVRETLPDGSGLLSVFDPDDVQSFLLQTRIRPDRRSHLALQKYRLDRPHMYSSGGLLPSNGEDWLRLRRPSQAVFGRPDVVASRLPQVDQIVRDFISLLRALRTADLQVPDLLHRIKMMNMEVMLMVLFGERFGCVTERPSAQCSALMEAGGRSTRAIFKTDNGPLRLYRYVSTPLYRQLVDSQDYIYSVAKQKYEEAKSRKGSEEAPSGGGTTVLEGLMRAQQLGEREVMGLLCDALMAGVDTTSYALAFALYHLACNSGPQQRLADETHALMATSHGRVTEDVLRAAKYTRAALKESMRLIPISIGIGRINYSPILLRGYHIPAGTTIVSMNQHIGSNPLYFRDPEAFRPERFLEDSAELHHSHALLPFGQGSRMCIARSIARQAVHTTLLHMVNNFTLKWHGPKLGCKVRLINEPDAPLSLSFTDREVKASVSPQPAG
ncbi:Cytochrome P450 CYP302A1 [Hyalella azteca]|uniref:Cytochrome P450 302a1, mitochondrial n=1 Tax=Hyalella azteca TaxID=294128 RepID=A0A6A0H1H7_HYAAZ|nr:cytochrome P450 302a1, mitochondrial [Hyalella azteca]KAA0195942.1 Cytochrome P450 CYP302A1 [Hyalella azteca]